MAVKPRDDKLDRLKVAGESVVSVGALPSESSAEQHYTAGSNAAASREKDGKERGLDERDIVLYEEMDIEGCPNRSVNE